MNGRLIHMAMLFLAVEVMMQGEASGDEAMFFSKMLPEEIAGWSASGEDHAYDRSTIFTYMNGAGEIYLAYDFRKLMVREYVKQSAPPIAAEIYQMASSEDAYGILTHDRDGKEVSVGQGGIYSAGLLRFWKGSLFVRLMAQEETRETHAAVMALGKQVAEAIPQKGTKPQITACLPAKGLIRTSVHYFHQQVSLNSHYFLADANLLNLSEKTEAVMARYQKDKRRVRLLLCRYSSPKEAEAAFERFCQIYFAGMPARKTAFRAEKVEKGEFVSARPLDRFVVLIFEAGDRKICEEMTEAAIRRIEEVLK